jgi:hypothetical protein
MAANRDRGRPHDLTPPTPPYIRITNTAVRSLQHACACPDVDEVAPHGSLTPGRATCRASESLLACTTVQAFGAPRAPTMPSADSSPGISADCSALSQFPWHATSRGTGEASRGQLSYRRCIDAGFIKHSPAVDGGLCCRVPARPGCTTPRIRFVSLAPHLRSTLPSDASSRRRPCASLVLRLHAHLDRRLSLPSMTACTAHTLRFSGGAERRPLQPVDTY